MRLAIGLSAGLLVAGLLAGCAAEPRPALGPRSAYSNNDTYDNRDCSAADQCVDYGYSGYPANVYPPAAGYRPYAYRQYGYRDCAYGNGCTDWHED